MFSSQLLQKTSISILIASILAFGKMRSCDSLLIESARIDSIQKSFSPRPPYPTAQAFREDEQIKTMRKTLEPDIAPCLALKEERDRHAHDSIQNIEMRNRQKARKKQDVGFAIVVAGLSVGAVIVGFIIMDALLTSILPSSMDP